MEISLESAQRRKILLAASLAIAIVIIFEAGRLWLATSRLDSGQLELMERGAALMPGNGAAWESIGTLRQWDFANPDLAGALADFQKAVRDDPRSAQYWMDLASAYEASGETARARDAFLRAQSVYPASAEVAFHYGNFLLRQEQYSEGYAQFQRAVRADPTLLPLVISRTWRSSGDVDALLHQAIPANTEAYLQAIDYFASIQQSQAALAAWKGLLALKQPVPLPRTFSFFEDLIREDRAEEARQAWPQALQAAGLPYDGPADGSLIWDGKFTRDFTDGGLDWHWVPLANVVINFDSDAVPNGSRAIRLDFNGGSNVALAAPSQFVPVQPSRNYHFHAYLRTQEITTESGVRFSLMDPNHAGALNLLTDNFLGSHPWTPIELDFATGPATHFLLVQLKRDPSTLFDSQINGSAWIADVSIFPSDAQTTQTRQAPR